MKVKDIFFITLKLIGLIALWKTILATGVLISYIGLIGSQFGSNLPGKNVIFYSLILSSLLNFVLPLLVSFFTLFKTNKVLTLLRLNSEEEISININKSRVYHVVVVVFAVILILNGASDFLEYNYQTNTQTAFNWENVQDGSPEKIVTTTDINTRSVNYFALFEVILGLVFLIWSADIAKRFENSFKSNSSKSIQVNNEVEISTTSPSS